MEFWLTLFAIAIPLIGIGAALVNSRDAPARTEQTPEGITWGLEDDILNEVISEGTKAAEAESSGGDSRLVLLGLSPGFTLAELRASFNEKEHLWGARRYVISSPEILDVLNDQASNIREAYESLLLESQTCAEEESRYALLKLAPGCSLDEIRAAYHREAALWHPDKLAHLAPELQEQAQKRMTELNDAYGSLSRELASSST